MEKKKTAVGASNPNTGVFMVNGKKVELSTIRSKFTGISKEAQALPDGKGKSAILNEIENAYVDTINFFKGLAGAAATA